MTTKTQEVDAPKPEAVSNSNHKNIVMHHMTQDIRPTFMSESLLILLTFCTGIQDATTFPDYHCFASNQTGNTIFLCVALVLPQFNGDMFITSNIGIALGLFLGGGWLTGQLSHIVGAKKRWWLFICNLIQSCLVMGAAGIQYKYGIHAEGPKALSVVGLLALAAGSQVVQSRSLKMTEISTAMATAAWVDLMIDQKLLVLKNRPRTRRVAFLASLVLGGITGAFIYREVGTATAIAVSGAGKLLVTFAYLLVGSEKELSEPSAV